MAERALISKASEPKWKAPSSRLQKPDHTRSIKSSALQAKLRIGHPNDIYEQEADRVAEQIMRMPDPVLQRRCANCDEDEKRVLQAKRYPEQASSNQGQVVPSIVHDVLRSPGQPLDSATRAFMEPRFGHDFSGVKVHSDVKAAESARAVDAKAYTCGKDIAFDEYEYAPNTLAGQSLLAHELTHVIQQGGIFNSLMSKKSDEKQVEQSTEKDLTKMVVDGTMPLKLAIYDSESYPSDFFKHQAKMIAQTIQAVSIP
jgi:hypothetical protein